MANPRRLYHIREWILRDLTSRDYANMADNTAIATDMVETERVPRGFLSKWDVLSKVVDTEVNAQFNGAAGAHGIDPESRRTRAAAFFSFMAGDTGLVVPREHYSTIQSVVRWFFGPTSDTITAVKALLDADDMSRAEWLGWFAETVPRFTTRIDKAMALPPPTPEQQRQIDAWIEAQLRSTNGGAQQQTASTGGPGARRR